MTEHPYFKSLRESGKVQPPKRPYRCGGDRGTYSFPGYPGQKERAVGGYVPPDVGVAVCGRVPSRCPECNGVAVVEGRSKRHGLERLYCKTEGCPNHHKGRGGWMAYR